MMFGFIKKKCVGETEGKIVKIHFNDNGSRRLTVEYPINGQTYQLKENITAKMETVKIGKVPVGQKKIEYIVEGIGGTVIVKYNPNNPKQAYLRDNKGNRERQPLLSCCHTGISLCGRCPEQIRIFHVIGAK